MKASDDLKPQFIRKDDIKDGGIIVTVSDAERRDMSRNVATHDYKWILTFSEGWRLQLNDTNLRRVIDLLGDEADDWPGQRLGLIHDPEITFHDEVIGGIRVVPATDIKRKKGQEPQDDEGIPFA
jgi:hypothetical protein